MQFGSTNITAECEGNINNAIREALDDFALAYLDDVLQFHDSKEGYVVHVKWIVQSLLES
jgi:hypothetical protein